VGICGSRHPASDPVCLLFPGPPRQCAVARGFCFMGAVSLALCGVRLPALAQYLRKFPKLFFEVYSAVQEAVMAPKHVMMCRLCARVRVYLYTDIRIYIHMLYIT